MPRNRRKPQQESRIRAMDAMLFQQTGMHLWHVAQEGYKQHGRGAVLVDLRQGTKSPIPSEYLWEKQPGDWDRFSHDTTDIVRTYDPDHQMVVIIIGRIDQPGDKTIRTHQIRHRELAA